MRLQLTISSLAILVLSACATAPSPGKHLTQKEVDQYGTKEFNAPPAKAFSASVDALKTLGYKIAVQSPDKGKIVTERLTHAVFTQATSTYSTATAVSNSVSRQYALRVVEAGGKSKVIATPSVFVNNVDVSQNDQWILDGDQGEIKLWADLFNKIQENL